MKNILKFISVAALSALMVLGVMIGFSPAAKKSDSLSNEGSISSAYGGETYDMSSITTANQSSCFERPNTIRINTAADFTKLSDITNGRNGYAIDSCDGVTFEVAIGKTYTLTNFYPISNNSSTPFCGIILSNASNLNTLPIISYDSTSGSFIGFANNAEIKMLKFSANITTSSASAVGGVVGKATSSVINTCFVTSCAINVSGNAYCGGIAGSIVNNSTIVNCTSSGSLSTRLYCGGIVGNLENSEVINCITNATVSSSAGGKGGIAGFTKDGTQKNTYYYGKTTSLNSRGTVTATDIQSAIVSLNEFVTNSSSTSEFGLISWRYFSRTEQTYIQVPYTTTEITGTEVIKVPRTKLSFSTNGSFWFWNWSVTEKEIANEYITKTVNTYETVTRYRTEVSSNIVSGIEPTAEYVTVTFNYVSPQGSSKTISYQKGSTLDVANFPETSADTSTAYFIAWTENNTPVEGETLTLDSDRTINASWGRTLVINTKDGNAVNSNYFYGTFSRSIYSQDKNAVVTLNDLLPASLASGTYAYDATNGQYVFLGYSRYAAAKEADAAIFDGQNLVLHSNFTFDGDDQWYAVWGKKVNFFNEYGVRLSQYNNVYNVRGSSYYFTSTNNESAGNYNAFFDFSTLNSLSTEPYTIFKGLYVPDQINESGFPVKDTNGKALYSDYVTYNNNGTYTSKANYSDDLLIVNYPPRYEINFELTTGKFLEETFEISHPSLSPIYVSVGEQTFYSSKTATESSKLSMASYGNSSVITVPTPVTQKCYKFLGYSLSQPTTTEEGTADFLVYDAITNKFSFASGLVSWQQVGGSVTLYPIWQYSGSFSIKYILDNGQSDFVQNFDYTEDGLSGVNTKLFVPTKPGYTLSSWKLTNIETLLNLFAFKSSALRESGGLYYYGETTSYPVTAIGTYNAETYYVPSADSFSKLYSTGPSIFYDLDGDNVKDGIGEPKVLKTDVQEFVVSHDETNGYYIDVDSSSAYTEGVDFLIGTYSNKYLLSDSRYSVNGRIGTQSTINALTVNAEDVRYIASNTNLSVSLTAQWTPLSTTVVVNSKGGTSSHNSIEVAYNQDLSTADFANVTFQKTGYVYDTIMYTTSDGRIGTFASTIAGFVFASSILVRPVEATNYWDFYNTTSLTNAVITIYPVWTPITYYVDFNFKTLFGTSVEDKVYRQTFSYNGTESFDSYTSMASDLGFNIKFYDFMGWSLVDHTSDDLANETYSDLYQSYISYANSYGVGSSTVKNNLTSTNGEAITLYPVWLPKTYNYYFVMKSLDSIYDEGILLPNFNGVSSQKALDYFVFREGEGTYNNKSSDILLGNTVEAYQNGPFQNAMLYPIDYTFGSGEMSLANYSVFVPGYKFMGWRIRYVGSAATDQTISSINFSLEGSEEPPTEIVYIYPIFEEASITVVYNAADATKDRFYMNRTTSSVSSINDTLAGGLTVSRGTGLSTNFTINQMLYTLERTGYNFQNWFVNDNDSETTTDFFNNKITLASPSSSEKYATLYNEYFKLYKYASLTEGSEFEGRYSGKYYVNIYPYWTPKSYKITLHLDGASFQNNYYVSGGIYTEGENESTYAYTVYYDNALYNSITKTYTYSTTEIALPNNEKDNFGYPKLVLTKSGHYFRGWFTNKSYNSSTEAYEYSGLKESIPQKISANLDLYANFEGATYNITYQTNGGSWVAGQTKAIQYKYGEGATLPTSDSIRRESYVFFGWYRDAAFTDGPVTTIDAYDYNNKVYYALWKFTTLKSVTATGEEPIAILQSNSGVNGDFTLIAYDLTADMRYYNELADVRKKYDVQAFYDVTLRKNNALTIVQPGKAITVKLKLNENLATKQNLSVLVVDENGAYEEIAAEVKDGYISFETDFLSYFAVVEDLPTTIEKVMPSWAWGLIGGGAVLIAGIGIVLFYSNRKKKTFIR